MYMCHSPSTYWWNIKLYHSLYVCICATVQVHTFALVCRCAWVLYFPSPLSVSPRPWRTRWGTRKLSGGLPSTTKHGAMKLYLATSMPRWGLHNWWQILTEGLQIFFCVWMFSFASHIVSSPSTYIGQSTQNWTGASSGHSSPIVPL